MIMVMADETPPSVSPDVLLALGQYLATLRKFRWLPGMLIAGGGGMRVLDADTTRIVSSGGLGIVQVHDWSSGRIRTSTGDGTDVWTDAPLCPDLDDPAGATLGGLLQLVREAWGDSTIGTAPAAGHDGAVLWTVVRWDGTSVQPMHARLYPSEAHGLVASLAIARLPGLL